jgi:surface polysaccharide O-acyltransferase-like enzyme
LPRVIFIDLARFMAVVMMVYGHTASAVLAPRFRSGTWFELWTFQRGITSSLFLLVSGFAFAVATSRRWAVHGRWSPAVARRLRRFAAFVLFGYALHLPVRPLRALPLAGADEWRAFLAVDVLQLIGVTFIVLQLLLLVIRSRRVFAAAMAAAAAGVVGIASTAWSTDWAQSAHVSPAIAAYLTGQAGSLFPVVPSAAYILVGAALGTLFARWDAGRLRAFAATMLIVPGLALTGAMLAVRFGGITVFGHGPFAWLPEDVLLRIGVSLLILGGLARASRQLGHLPHWMTAVAQQSLLIYVVHLWIVYGSIWNRGLLSAYSGALGPASTIAVSAALLGSMVLLAVSWHRLKYARPTAARWTSVAACAVLFIALL